MKPNALDRAIGWVAPRWAARRILARFQMKVAQAYYDGASTGRRTSSLRRSGADANTITERTLPRLRQHSRDLVRNNPHAKRGVEAIVNNIGTASPHFVRGKEAATDLRDLARQHLETTECDVDGRLTYAGIQAAALDGTVQGGELLIRRRWRRTRDGLAVPVQFQLLEPEFLDTSKDGPTRDGGRIIQGVEFGPDGRRRSYHLFGEHPGGRSFHSQSTPVPARDIAPVYRLDRPGQVRGIPWLAAVILRLADFADYEDAQLMRQKIAACFSVFVTESFDNSLPGSVTGNADGNLIENLEPGIVERLPVGSEVAFANPPGVDGYHEYASVSLHAIAAGLGISYESFTGDLRGVNFGSGKMGRLEMQRNIERWQRDILVAQIGQVLMGWWLEAAELAGANTEGVTVRHMVASGDMVDPTREWKAERDAIRSGQKTLIQAIRERGRDPQEFLEEYKEGLDMLDELEIVLDSDSRQRTAVGNEVGAGSSGGGEGDGEMDEAAMDDLVEALGARLANGARR